MAKKNDDKPADLDDRIAQAEAEGVKAGDPGTVPGTEGRSVADAAAEAAVVPHGTREEALPAFGGGFTYEDAQPGGGIPPNKVVEGLKRPLAPDDEPVLADPASDYSRDEMAKVEEKKAKAADKAAADSAKPEKK